MHRVVALNEAGLRIGETHQNARITDHEVEIIRRLHEQGLTYKQIADKFEISRHTVGRICRYERRGQTFHSYKKIEE